MKDIIKNVELSQTAVLFLYLLTVVTCVLMRF